MAQTELQLARVEGGLRLARVPERRVQLRGAPGRNIEAQLLGRTGLDAIYLTQRISADNGPAHAIAAAAAVEAALDINVAEAGQALRELLHSLSLMHAHVRQFYVQALPDYLPPATLARYEGGVAKLQHIREAAAQADKGSWLAHDYGNPFGSAELSVLWEHRLEAERMVSLLQRMMAALGGKYPMVMGIVPGGVSWRLDVPRVLRLRAYLQEVRHFLETTLPQDVALVVRRHPETIRLGRGSDDFISVGSGVNEIIPEGTLFPSGVYLSERLESFEPIATESISNTFARIQSGQGALGQAFQPAPDKTGAYSWIKAPRYQDKAMETGPYARLVIAYLSGIRLWQPSLIEQLESLQSVPITRGNTVAGRLMTRAAEVGGLVRHCETLLDALDPAQPTVTPREGRPSGEGIGLVESPAGAVQHRLVIDAGRITQYDIVSACAWNGGPTDGKGVPSPLESALNEQRLDFDDPGQRRALSRIVHSFAFSMTDAVH